MIIKEDFYDIVCVQDGGFIEEAISDGIKAYLEKLGFNTESFSYNINIEMYVDSDELIKFKETATQLLNSYCDVLSMEIDSSVNDKEIIEDYERELEIVTDFLDEYN